MPEPTAGALRAAQEIVKVINLDGSRKLNGQAVHDIAVIIDREMSQPSAAGRPTATKQATSSGQPAMTSNQRNKLIELYIERFGGTEQEALEGLDAVFESAFKHPLPDVSITEASKIISQMINAKTAFNAKNAFVSKKAYSGRS